jgi:hypothetical protein
MIVETDPWRVKRWFCHVPTGRVSNRLFDLTPGVEIDPTGLAWFLTKGAVPGCGTLFENIVCLPGGATIDVSPGQLKMLSRRAHEDVPLEQLTTRSADALVDLGAKRMREALDRFFETCTQGLTLGVSGGYDSRALLTAALEHMPAKNIRTFTFGSPGTYDYDYPHALAQRTGIEHRAYDLSEILWDTDRVRRGCDLIDGVAHIGRPHDLIARDYGAAPLVATGLSFVASSATAIARREGRDPWETQLEESRYAYSIPDLASLLLGHTVTADDLSRMPVDVADTLPGGPIWSENYNHIERYCGPICLPRGVNWRAPLLDEKWQSYWYAVPEMIRGDYSFYERIVKTAYPTLIDPGVRTRQKPGTNTEKLSLSRRVVRRLRRGIRAKPINPMIEYIQFARGFRERADLVELAQTNLARLKARGVVDADSVTRIWREHQSGDANHARALIAMICLEATLEGAQAG